MKKTLFLIVLLLVIVAFPMWSAPRSRGKSGSYSVETRTHTQTLGGKSGSSSKGLQVAAGRSNAINGPIDKPGPVEVIEEKVDTPEK